MKKLDESQAGIKIAMRNINNLINADDTTLLDGGHALFLIAEMITGKQPSDKFMERAQMVGMLIILGLFVLAMYNDLTRFVF